MVPKGPSLHELRLLCQQSGAEEPRKNAEVTPHPSARALGAPGFVSACVFWHDGSMIVQAIVQVRMFKNNSYLSWTQCGYENWRFCISTRRYKDANNLKLLRKPLELCYDKVRSILMFSHQIICEGCRQRCLAVGYNKEDKVTHGHHRYPSVVN